MLRPLPADRCQRIRDAIDAAGSSGLDRTEIWALTSRGYAARQLDNALADLVDSGAYEPYIAAAPGTTRLSVRYRRRRTRRPSSGGRATFITAAAFDSSEPLRG